MTVDDLAKLIESTAKAMKLPLSKISVFDTRRPLQFGKRRAERANAPDPYVTCEIQDEASMKMGKMTVKLSEVNAAVRASVIINDHLIAAGLAAGIEDRGRFYRCRS